MRHLARSFAILMIVLGALSALAGSAAAQTVQAGCVFEAAGDGRQILHCQRNVTITLERGARFSLADRDSDGNADALLLRGVVKGEMFKEESGLEDIRAAMAIKPDIAGGGMSAGILLFEMKRYEEAIAQFTQVIETDTSDLATAYYYRADCYYAMDDKDNACINWRRSGELGDKDAQFIVRNYCSTDATKIPKKPRKDKKSVIEF